MVGTSREAIWQLAVLYSRTGRQREAAGCIQRLHAMALSDEEHSRCQLAMGQLQEQLGDFEAAAESYRGGLELPTCPGDTRRGPLWGTRRAWQRFPTWPIRSRSVAEPSRSRTPC